MSFTNLIPDQSNSDIIIKGTPGAEKPCPPSTTATRCTFVKVLKRCFTRLVPKARHPSSSRGKLDPSTLVDEKFSQPSTSPVATDPTVHDHDSEPVPGVTTCKSLTEGGEKAVLAVEALATDATPNPAHVLIQGKKDHGCHCYELNAKDTGETKENGCEADISGEWHGFVGYDGEDTYRDDFEYPEHRELKLAIEHLLLHRVPNTITEATEEGGGNDEVGEGSAASQAQAARVSRTVPPLPIIGRFPLSLSPLPNEAPILIHVVVQAPTAEAALRRAREATDDLAALLDSIDADSREGSHLSSRSSGSPTLVRDPDWLNGGLEHYYRTQFRVVSSQVNNDLVPNDPFADLHNTSSRPFFSR